MLLAASRGCQAWQMCGTLRAGQTAPGGEVHEAAMLTLQPGLPRLAETQAQRQRWLETTWDWQPERA